MKSKSSRLITGLVAFGALLAVASCDTSPPTAVSVAPPEELRLPNGLLWGLDLLSCSPLPGDSASALIGPAGGTIDVGPHQFRVPAGALDSTVLITAVAPSGNINRVQMSPSGLTFDIPARLELSYANCNGILSWLPKWVVQVDGQLNIIDVLFSITDFGDKTVTGRVHHFSEYAVAW